MTKEEPDTNTRELILDILLELSKENEYSNILIAAVLEKYDYLAPKEKAFIKRVSEGTIERRIQIDYVLGLFSKVPVEKMKALIRELLRMSVYQILFMDHIPDAAVCNEAVKLAKKRKFQSLQGFVNGVLRSVSRGKENISYPDKEKDLTNYLSVRYSMPVWLTEHFCTHYGTKACEEILKSFLKRKPVCIRLEENMSAEQRESLIHAWQETGAEVREHPYLPYAFELSKADGIRSLKGYAEGCFAVQDVSSMLVVQTAGIRPEDTVVDICAAPGGKTFHAASKLAGTGQVIACDVTEYKIRRLEENKARLQKENVIIKMQDARVFDESLEEKADVLIADVPCSGLGVIGRKQDIKYRVTKESLREIITLQREILQNAVRYVRPGGVLMYSTCTMNPDENEETVSWLTEEYPFALESMEKQLPKQLKEEGKKGYLQLLPGIHETDGFFVAKLRKRS